jgi:SAM-dependent methyltransferase
MILLAVLTECGSVAAARAYLAAKSGAPARAALALLDSHEEGADLAISVLRDMSDDRPSFMPSFAPEEWAKRFDRAVAISPEASVALYSLADPLLLAETTREMVGVIRSFGLLDGNPRVLEIGCGIGRFAAALAPMVAHYTGIDVSPGMVETARRRCAGCGNVVLGVTRGHDLAEFAASCVDLVMAIDVFPYLVASGADIARRHIEEASRLLVPGGSLLIMNYSYRDDLDRDREDAAENAARAGLTLVCNGTRDTEIWDGVTFLLRKGA